MSNLSPDWHLGYATCHDCGKRYHQSGTIECACRVCESEQCDATVINQSHCTQCEESTQCKLKSTGTYAKNVSASDTKAKSSDITTTYAYATSNG